MLAFFVLDRGKQFQLLIAALTTDPIAGQPLISYFLKTGNEIAEHNLRFWTASNQVLTDIHNNDTVTRRKQYQVLINLYLSSAANTKVSLTCSAKQELCTLLLKDIGVTRLIETCKAIAEVAMSLLVFRSFSISEFLLRYQCPGKEVL